MDEPGAIQLAGGDLVASELVDSARRRFGSIGPGRAGPDLPGHGWAGSRNFGEMTTEWYARLKCRGIHFRADIRKMIAILRFVTVIVEQLHYCICAATLAFTLMATSVKWLTLYLCKVNRRK